jgi:hypothetical protein
MFLQCISMSREDSAREPESSEVRGSDDIANQSGPIDFFPESTTSSTSYLSPIVRARPQHLKKAREPFIELFSSPILFATGLHFPSVLFYSQGYPKVCPNSLNLLNTGDSFAGISLLSSCYLFSQTRDLIAMF